ncbi:MAG: TIGR04282 family arsenosugar biosynthesis glycosyltransferase [Azonexus sp.]
MPRASTDRSIAIAILAKAPIPGLTKTRLIPYLGAAGASALQAWLLRRTVATALEAKLGPVTLWCAPDTTHPDFIDLAAGGQFTLRQQTDGDLGERMHQVLAESQAPAGTLVIGTDCPALDPTHLQQAAAALATHQAVVTSAEDGGYVLIGMRRADARVFDGVAWGSERVMAQTRERLRQIGWLWKEFEPLWDVDRNEDFKRLIIGFPEVQGWLSSATTTFPADGETRNAKASA